MSGPDSITSAEAARGPQDPAAPTGAQPPVIVIADDWGRHVSTTQHLFRRIVRSHDVIWVNSFGHRRPQLTWYDFRRALSKVAKMVSARKAPPTDGEGPRLIINPRALPWHNIEWVRRWNRGVVLAEVQRALAAVAPGRTPIFVTATPLGADLVGAFGERAAVYLCLDDYDQLPGVERNLLVPYEARLLALVDATIATAESLTHSKRPASGRTLHLPQGVNYAHFATPREAPPELANLPRPIIGFAGGVGPVIDRGLLQAVRDRFPSASIVLVGMHQEEIDPVAWPEGTHFLGARSYDVLPAYVQAFDVGLVPYVHNAHTAAVDPLKVLEYLAAGIPVVSTGLREVQKYATVVEVADGGAAFADAVARALDARTPADRDARQAVAAKHTWEQRVQTFLGYIDDLPPRAITAV